MDHNRPEHGSLGNIGASISNPTSDLWQVSMSFQALQFFDGDVNTGDSRLGSGVNLQPVMPFPLYGEGKDQWKLITRPIIPIVFNSPSPTGFDQFKNRGGIGDIQLPLLFNPPVSLLGSFIFGAGPVFEFPTATNSDARRSAVLDRSCGRLRLPQQVPDDRGLPELLLLNRIAQRSEERYART